MDQKKLLTMEFEELKKVWDTQNEAPMYVINTDAMHRIILQRKSQAGHIANISELLALVVNGGVGIFLFVTILSQRSVILFQYVIAAWLLLTVVYVALVRITRINNNRQFDRSMRGDLEHALATATHQVRLSRLMRWNLVPVAVFLALALWERDQSMWLTLGILAFFALAFYLSGWEHNFYVRRMKSLETLKSKLDA